MAGERQSVPARHGIATFVPKGHSIKIINTYGTQVIDTWAFALHKPPNEESDAEEKAEEEAINQAQQEAEKEIEKEQKSAADDIKDVEVAAEKKDETPDIPKTAVKDKPEAPQATAGAEAPPATATKPTTETVDGKKGKDATNTVNEQATGATSKEGDNNKGEEQKEQKAEGSAGAQVAGDTTPTQPESEGVKVAGTITPSDKSEDEYADAKSVQSSKSWGSYLPSIRSRAKAAYGVDQKAGTDPKESKGNTKSWSSYLPSGTSFTSYLPNSGKDALSAFASSHHRDPNKSYAEQLYEFSKTPVGAASLSAATGSGTAGSLYAAYTAYTKLQASQRRTGPMEYLSLPHTIDASQNLSPTEGDALLSNLHGPLLTLLEDTSPATTENVDPSVIPLRHGSILPACDPTTYKELAEEGEKGEEHGSCAENLVLALQEFNKSTGLKGARTVGADVTINSAPVPLMLFMNATVNPGTGKVVVQEPRKYQGGKWGKGGEKGGYVKLRAERDVVVVMSACPMDMGPTNSGRSMAANFIVEEPSDEEKVELKKDEEKEKEKQKPKVQTTSEKINAQKNEVKKAAPTQDVKKAAPKQEIKKAAPKQEIKKAAPKQEVKKTVENEKRRDSAHGAVGGAAAKPTRPSLEDKTKFSSSGVQTPRTETSATSNEPIRNVPKPGKKRPKKLDRRSSSMAPTPA